MQAYFEHRQSPSPGILLAFITSALLALFGLGMAHQILTGWIAFGDRVNISRHSLNTQEILIAAGSLLLGLAALRTFVGIIRREAAAWAWIQWLSFVAIFVGFGIGMSSVLRSAAEQGTELDAATVILGGVIFLLAVLVYSYSTQGADSSPDEYFRIQLSDSPSAGAILGFVAIFIGFSMATDLFLEPTSIGSILSNNATKGIIAIGITLLMISGEFDLSVGSVLGATAMIFMNAMTEGFGPLGPQPVLVAALIALAFASLLGLINGIVFITTGIPSFIVTLGTLFAYRAISLVAIAGGRILRYRDYYDEFPQVYINRWLMILGAGLLLLAVLYVMYRVLPGYWRSFQYRLQHWRESSFGITQAVLSFLAFALSTALLSITVLWLALVMLYHAQNLDSLLQVGAFDILNGRWAFTLEEVTQGAMSIEIPSSANFRMSIVWWLIMVVFFQIILINTPYGNAVFATGGNIGAARAQGINANRIKVQNFVLCSFLAGVAAIFEVARNPGVDPLKGQTWELEVIAMTVIGGALLTGGYGSIIGTMLGVLIFGMLQTGLVLVGMDSRMFQGVIGIIMIIAVVLNNITKRQGNLGFGGVFNAFRRLNIFRSTEERR